MASTTIQSQRRVPCSEIFKVNKLKIFDGTSHGTILLPHGTTDDVTGQHFQAQMFRLPSAGHYLPISYNRKEKKFHESEIFWYVAKKKRREKRQPRAP